MPDAIADGDLIRLWDRALIAVMVYSFARVEAALGMDVGNFYPNGKRRWFRLREPLPLRLSFSCKRDGCPLHARGSRRRCSISMTHPPNDRPHSHSLLPVGILEILYRNTSASALAKNENCVWRTVR